MSEIPRMRRIHPFEEGSSLGTWGRGAGRGGERRGNLETKFSRGGIIMPDDLAGEKCALEE